jgi:hypothetical protein
MSHPLTACISEIELLQERIAEKNDRIEALEAALMTEWAARDNRIEALETALREIAGQMLVDEHDEDYNGDYEAGYEAIVRIARAALAPEQDKP